MSRFDEEYPVANQDEDFSPNPPVDLFGDEEQVYDEPFDDFFDDFEDFDDDDEEEPMDGDLA